MEELKELNQKFNCLEMLQHLRESVLVAQFESQDTPADLYEKMIFIQELEKIFRLYNRDVEEKPEADFST